MDFNKLCQLKLLIFSVVVIQLSTFVSCADISDLQAPCHRGKAYRYIGDSIHDSCFQFFISKFTKFRNIPLFKWESRKFRQIYKKKNMNFHETKKLTHTVNSVLSFEDISIFEIISNLPRLVLCHVQEKTHLFATAQIL